jgi:NAD(P)-dependent dehydrogenase (short-subunit alcohol dehydrogenase family)
MPAGGGADIGRAVAEGFGCEGTKIVIAEINRANGEAAAAAIQAAGGEAHFVQTDVSRAAEIEAMVME